MDTDNDAVKRANQRRKQLLLMLAMTVACIEFAPDSMAIQIPDTRFNFKRLDSPTCKFLFRFDKKQIEDLVVELRLPDVVITKAGHKALALEALLILLRRMAYPGRLGDITQHFGRSRTAIIFIFNNVLLHIFRRFKHLLLWDTHRITEQKLIQFADAYHAQGAPLIDCIGDPDGTVRQMCRPGKGVQKAAYNGHKWKHALKWQSISCPDGIIAHLHGPEPGSRHDLTFVVYGDPAYGLKDWMVSPFKGAQLTEEQDAFNKAMSRVRVTVEWAFGLIVANWAFVDFHKNLKLWLQPVGVYYNVAALLTNMLTCCKGANELSIFFALDPPTLNEYLHSSPAPTELGDDQEEDDE
ncbi:hypothetical protein BCR33DRAFT_796463 [Rhizoclosmatium globosum]|uniref:DDE Tnp4 domain-containing protein n=1 Tax=Rhizoclosmatium globosum TaxID=329046 RepID=A0A1Y2ALT8_9FUNG|nr:hypothetical protein BCR33DRAFT_796463 [Rhizoclosmatium globosum]|eukprot:ORY23454.1 hypothetical protein BCR33DRAFT_796463 [Rhizoclosmatium globosum]